MAWLRDAVKQSHARTGGLVLILQGAVGCTSCGGSRRATVLLGLAPAGPETEPTSVREAQVVKVAACETCGRPRRGET